MSIDVSWSPLASKRYCIRLSFFSLPLIFSLPLSPCDFYSHHYAVCYAIHYAPSLFIPIVVCCPLITAFFLLHFSLSFYGIQGDPRYPFPFPIPSIYSFENLPPWHFSSSLALSSFTPRFISSWHSVYVSICCIFTWLLESNEIDLHSFSNHRFARNSNAMTSMALTIRAHRPDRPGSKFETSIHANGITSFIQPAFHANSKHSTNIISV